MRIHDCLFFETVFSSSCTAKRPCSTSGFPAFGYFATTSKCLTVKKSLVHRDLGADAMAESFYFWHYKINNQKIAQRIPNFEYLYLNIYRFNKAETFTTTCSCFIHTLHGVKRLSSSIATFKRKLNSVGWSNIRRRCHGSPRKSGLFHVVLGVEYQE